MKQLRQFILLAALAICLAHPACAYYFQGYYVPSILISPMRDSAVYTPVGLGIVTSHAGFRIHPVTHRGDFHSGVDLAAKLNDKVYNLVPGYVTRVGWRGNLGVAVEIYCPYPNVRVICGHLNAYSVQPGMWVQRGRVIGYAGSTGRSTGVHVHYTVIKNSTNQYVDPMAYLMQVPRYIQALKNTQIKRAIVNKDTFKSSLAKKPEVKVNDSDTDDLPKDDAETAPPD